jgi:hypothetical protein
MSGSLEVFLGDRRDCWCIPLVASVAGAETRFGGSLRLWESPRRWFRSSPSASRIVSGSWQSARAEGRSCLKNVPVKTRVRYLGDWGLMMPTFIPSSCSAMRIGTRGSESLEITTATSPSFTVVRSSGYGWTGAQLAFARPPVAIRDSKVRRWLNLGTRIRRLGASPGHESESGQNRASFGSLPAGYGPGFPVEDHDSAGVS